MSTRKAQAPLMGTQAASEIGALDFAAASDALTAAFAAGNPDLIAARADALIGIPTSQPAQIAEKVVAFGWLENYFAGPLTQERVEQIAIHGWGQEPSKRLLAIYLDLTAPLPASDSLASLIAEAKEADARLENSAEDMNSPAFAALVATRNSAEAALRAYAPTTVAEAATKLEALRALENFDEDAQSNIEALGRDLAVLALARRSDAIATVDRAPWDAAVSRYQAALVERDRLTALEEGNGEDTSEEWNEADNALGEALEALLNTRAPDAAAMGYKARLVIERNCLFYSEDSPDSPAFISHLLAEGWDEHGPPALYQDGPALAGIGGPVVDATPDRFDRAEWLERTEAETGSRLVRSDGYSPCVHFEGGDTARAGRRLAQLPAWHRYAVESGASHRAMAEAAAAARAAPQRAATSDADLQGIFAQGLLNTTPEDQRAAVASALESLGITPVQMGGSEAGEGATGQLDRV